MAAHTLGRRIRDREREVKIFGQRFQLKAEVTEINALSAHADYREIGEYVSVLDLNKLKKVFLVHGQPKAQEHLSGHLLESGVKEVTIIKYGEEYELQRDLCLMTPATGSAGRQVSSMVGLNLRGISPARKATTVLEQRLPKYDEMIKASMECIAESVRYSFRPSRASELTSPSVSAQC